MPEVSQVPQTSLSSYQSTCRKSSSVKSEKFTAVVIVGLQIIPIFFVLCATLIRKLPPPPLSGITAPVVTFAVRFIPSNQPHLALHLALLSLAEFPDCAELPASRV